MNVNVDAILGKSNLPDYDIKFNKHNAEAVWELKNKLADICNANDPDADDEVTSEIWDKIIYPIQQNFEKLGLVTLHREQTTQKVICTGFDGTTEPHEDTIPWEHTWYTLNW